VRAQIDQQPSPSRPGGQPPRTGRAAIASAYHLKRPVLPIASADAVRYARDVINRHHGPVTADLSALVVRDAQGWSL
jgi:hypothetical protein